MNYFQNNSWQKWVFIGLVLLNIFSLSIIWTKNGPPIPSFGQEAISPESKRQQADQYLMNQLGFNSEQRKQFAIISKNHAENQKELRFKISQSKESFFELMQQSQMDSLEVRQRGEELAKWQVKLEESTFYYFTAIRTIGTPEQKQKFDEVIFNALRKFGPSQTPKP